MQSKSVKYAMFVKTNYEHEWVKAHLIFFQKGYGAKVHTIEAMGQNDC